MTVRIQLRRDLAANWTSINPVLHAGEPGFELDTNKLKIGDGVNAWNALAYQAGGGSGGGGFPFVQASPQFVWTINHNLGYRPGCTLFDAGGTKYEADIANPNVNQTVVTHVVATAGTAWLI